MDSPLRPIEDLRALTEFFVKHHLCAAGFDATEPDEDSSGRATIICRGCGGRFEHADPAEVAGRPRPAAVASTPALVGAAAASAPAAAAAGSHEPSPLGDRRARRRDLRVATPIAALAATAAALAALRIAGLGTPFVESDKTASTLDGTRGGTTGADVVSRVAPSHVLDQQGSSNPVDRVVASRTASGRFVSFVGGTSAGSGAALASPGGGAGGPFHGPQSGSGQPGGGGGPGGLPVPSPPRPPAHIPSPPPPPPPPVTPSPPPRTPTSEPPVTPPPTTNPQPPQNCGGGSDQGDQGNEGHGNGHAYGHYGHHAD